ncbi:hypothetical protein QM565_04225 [Geitlerinema splendidum]|nr:hypothetical protein [Geitlerinema splendidum]
MLLHVAEIGLLNEYPTELKYWQWADIGKHKAKVRVARRLLKSFIYATVLGSQ